MIVITENQEEMFDVVDKDDNVIGKARRGEVHLNKLLIHRSIAVAVFNKKGEIFLQQRSKTKDTDPLKWTVSCTGHVLSGDSYEDTARKEMLEELGVDLPIKKLGKILYRTLHETEMAMLYKAYSDGPFTLNQQEILQGKFFSQDQLKKRVKSFHMELSQAGKIALKKLGFFGSS